MGSLGKSPVSGLACPSPCVFRGAPSQRLSRWEREERKRRQGQVSLPLAEGGDRDVTKQKQGQLLSLRSSGVVSLTLRTRMTEGCCPLLAALLGLARACPLAALGPLGAS